MGSSDATLSSPEDLFDKLRLRYSLRMSYTKFHELTIGPKEDLESFAHRITKMGRITASGNTLGVDDKMLRERFMHGIDRLVGDELVRRSPASLQEALRMAIVIREETRTARRPQLHAENSPNQWLDQIECYLCHQHGHGYRRCPKSTPEQIAKQKMRCDDARQKRTTSGQSGNVRAAK